ncbi:hypothetical protein PoB_004832200 [Plakobranchus ocellatus]|uniref:Uncharacterized protein n=1 Tax=Plakobranchus ocellatus TaxID=259542 RepID=A0AAV4BR24_9GAST|nr:hypothetical protein PoB_004832200 [Plakobranchus ocellatus]
MLVLNNTGSHPWSQTGTSTDLPSLLVTPAAEAVYEPGEDLQVFVDMDYPENYIRSDVIWDSVLFDIDEEKTVDSLDVIDLSPAPSDYEYLNESTTFRIKTSIRPISGYMYFRRAFVSISSSSLITKHWSFQSLVLRPVDQTGPFPERTIVPRYGDEISYSSCWIFSGHEETCKESCEFVGDAISGVDVKEVLPNGTERDVERLNFPAQNIFNSSHSEAIDWSFQAVRGMGNITFKCRAFDSRHGTEATQLITVSVYFRTL